MQKSYGEGIASHTGPESCGAVCEGGVEALTRVRAGRVLSRERCYLRGADAVTTGGRLHRSRRCGETRPDPARSETPGTYGYPSHENREVLWSPAANAAAGRVGKSTDGRRR